MDPQQARFFNPFFSPFFFQRRFFPFFFLSPFFSPFFPFYREGDDRDGMYYAQHRCQAGDTVSGLAQRYNVPAPILEAMNPHIPNPHALTAGTVVGIPRMDKMFCSRMYAEQGPAGTAQYPTTQFPQQTMSHTGVPYMPTTAYTGMPGTTGMPSQM